MNNYVAVTDGAYSSKLKQGGSAFLILKDDIPILDWSKSWKGGSNNTAEILAIIFAFKAIHNPIDSFLIVSDSQYALGVMFQGWKRNKNKKLLELFDKEYERVSQLCPSIRYAHIRGHGKSSSKYAKYNDIVDRMCVRESQKTQSLVL